MGVMMWKPLQMCVASLLMVFLVPTQSDAQVRGKFFMINDVHLDPSYETSGDSCNIKVPLGERMKRPYGHYDCDSSLKLFHSAINKADQESGADDTDFIVVAGDLVTHLRKDVKSTFTRANTTDILNSTAVLMKDRLVSGVPIFLMLGNHDYLPKNQLPVNSNDELYKKIADIFCPLFIGDAGCTKFSEAGFYASELNDKLKVVIMNTNLYSVNNNAVNPNDPDPAGQFEWLQTQLRNSRDKNQKVHLFAHIPPGVLETTRNITMFRDTFNTNFNNIVRDYASTIIGIYSGHTHTDSFRVIYSKEHVPQPLVSLLIAPSVSPWRYINTAGYAALARNPALRSVHYETTGDLTLKEVTQYYLRLDTANAKALKTPWETIEWQEEYFFTKSYELSNLSARSLHNLVKGFRQPANNMFHKYFDHNSVDIHWNQDKPTNGKYYCDCHCKLDHICAISNVDYAAYRQCLVDELGEICAGSGSSRLWRAKEWQGALTLALFLTGVLNKML